MKQKTTVSVPDMAKVDSSTIAATPIVDRKGVMGKAVALPANTQVITKQEIAFKEIAFEIIKSTVELGEKYLTLCLMIRSNNIAPKQVSTWLKDVGFHKVRISEINRIAHGPDDVFEKFKARSIGFRGALQLSRGNLEEMKKITEVANDPSLAALAAECEIEAAEEEKEVSSALPANASAQEKMEAKRQIRVDTLTKKAVGILAGAEIAFPKGHTWTNGVYVLTLTRKVAKVKGPKSPVSPVGAPTVGA
jgi:hypothetical protein